MSLDYRWSQHAQRKQQRHGNATLAIGMRLRLSLPCFLGKEAIIPSPLLHRLDTRIYVDVDSGLSAETKGGHGVHRPIPGYLRLLRR